MSACTLLCAREIRIGKQSASPFPDAEVSTNVTFRVERKDVQEFGVRIDLECSESNCVQVAFGCDADGDGNLSAACRDGERPTTINDQYVNDELSMFNGQYNMNNPLKEKTK